jgi:hypothetical protein
MDITEVADILLSIHEMTEEEALEFGVPLNERWRYFRLDTLKAPDMEPRDPNA